MYLLSQGARGTLWGVPALPEAPHLPVFYCFLPHWSRQQGFKPPVESTLAAKH